MAQGVGVAPGGFDGDVDAAVVGGLIELGDGVFVGVQGDAAKLFDEGEALGDSVADENGADAGVLEGEEHEQADGAAAADEGGVADGGLSQIGGVNGDTPRGSSMATVPLSMSSGTGKQQWAGTMRCSCRAP